MFDFIFHMTLQIKHKVEQKQICKLKKLGNGKF